MTNNVLECSGIIVNGQKTHLRSTEAIGAAKVRIVVELDTSHPRMQSHAYAEVWSPEALKWNRVAYLTSGEWTEETYARPGGRDLAQSDVLGASDNLRSQVEGLLA